MEARRLELLTSGLQSPRSAKLSYAPNASLHKNWLRGQDLNLRPLGYEPNELPGCSTPRQTFLVGLGGLEPPTSRLSGVRSNQLSYRPRVKNVIAFSPVTAHQTAIRVKLKFTNIKRDVSKLGKQINVNV